MKKTLIFQNKSYPHITKNILVKGTDELDLKQKIKAAKKEMKDSGYKYKTMV